MDGLIFPRYQLSEVFRPFPVRYNMTEQQLFMVVISIILVFVPQELKSDCQAAIS